MEIVFYLSILIIYNFLQIFKWLAKIQALKKKADQLLADKMFTESVAAFTKMNELIKQHVEEEVSMDVDSSKPSQSTLPTKDVSSMHIKPK